MEGNFINAHSRICYLELSCFIECHDSDHYVNLDLMMCIVS